MLSDISLVLSVLGLVLSGLAFQHSRRMSTRTLRVDLRNAISDLQRDASSTESLARLALGSRQSVFTALGQGRGGSMEHFRHVFGEDIVSIRAVRDAAGEFPKDLKPLSLDELEEVQVKQHELTRQLSALHEKYANSYAKDDQSREQIANRAAQRAQALGKQL